MSLKRRNMTAWILLLLASVCWTFGQQMMDTDWGNSITESTHPGEYENTTGATFDPETMPVTGTDEDWTIAGGLPTSAPVPSEPYDDAETDDRTERQIGFLVSFGAIAAASVAIFVLSQKDPILGPDGICLILAVLTMAKQALQNRESIMWGSGAAAFAILSGILSAFFVLHSVRELFGWLRARFSLGWCLVHRMAKRCAAPQMSLLVFVGWIILSLAGLLYYYIGSVRYLAGFPAPFFGYLAASFFGFRCLWKYGADLNHFKKQLSNYQQGSPITVSDGAFAQTEAQLLEVQAQHEEAVRTAVTSERFKVELISNVSHDLRTPLTAILGYSELLQKEALSPEGQEQLRRLHLKAGYMNDLVESLFELTKVSSGVVESRKEEIDLVRLLEQTIGLFDDQLVSAGLTVRRSYGSEAIPIITDGARMHQVFANLLGNAIKYALAGTRIYLEVKETDNRILVRVMNTASYEMDFKPEEILQRFARGDKARSTKGSGLGLAIAQTYTESVGGSFRVSVDGDQFSAIVELPKTERNL